MIRTFRAISALTQKQSHLSVSQCQWNSYLTHPSHGFCTVEHYVLRKKAQMSTLPWIEREPLLKNINVEVMTLGSTSEELISNLQAINYHPAKLETIAVQMMKDYHEQLLQWKKYRSYQISDQEVQAHLLNHLVLLKNWILSRIIDSKVKASLLTELSNYILATVHLDTFKRLLNSIRQGWNQPNCRESIVDACFCLIYFDKESQEQFFQKAKPMLSKLKKTACLSLIDMIGRGLVNAPMYAYSQIEKNNSLFTLESLPHLAVKLDFVRRLKQHYSPSAESYFLSTIWIHLQNPRPFSLDELKLLCNIINEDTDTSTMSYVKYHVLSSWKEISKALVSSENDLEKIDLNELVELFQLINMFHHTNQLLYDNLDKSLHKVSHRLEALKMLLTQSPQTNNHPNQDKRAEWTKEVQYLEANLKRCCWRIAKIVKANNSPEIAVEGLSRNFKYLTSKTFLLVVRILKVMQLIDPQVIFDFQIIQTGLLRNCFNKSLIEGVLDALLERNGLKSNQTTTTLPIKLIRKLISFYYHNGGDIQNKAGITPSSEVIDIMLRVTEHCNDFEHYMILKLIMKAFENTQDATTYSKNKDNAKLILQPIIRERVEKSYARRFNLKEKVVNVGGEAYPYQALSSYLLVSQFGAEQTVSQASFINEVAVYGLKVLQGEALMQFILMCLQPKLKWHIEPLVLELAYRNTTLLLIYVSEISKFYLHSHFARYFPTLVSASLESVQQLKRIKDKSVFIVLQHMWYLVGQSKGPIELLNILEHDDSLISVVRGELVQRVYTDEELFGCTQQLLEEFPFLRTTAEKAARTDKGLNLQENLESRIATVSPSELITLLNVNKAYEYLMCKKNIKIPDDLPPPNTTNKNILTAYMCHKLYQRISKASSYDIPVLGKGSQLGADTYFQANDAKIINEIYNEIDFEVFRRPAQVNLDIEKQFAISNALMNFSGLNEFQLDNIELPQLNRYETWRKNIFVDYDLQIDELIGSDNVDSSIYLKLVKILFGNIQKINEIIMRFYYPNTVLSLVAHYKLNYDIKGAMIQIEMNPQNSFYLLNTRANNYKIFYICAHFLRLSGKEVYLIGTETSFTSIKTFFEKRIADFRLRGSSALPNTLAGDVIPASILSE